MSVPMDAAHNPKTATLTGTMVGRFAVGARAGSGGMGEVYLAEDTRLHRRVALKRMAPRLSADEHYHQRFLREAEHASRLSDPHVAAIYDVIEDGENVFLIMEYVEGETLRERGRSPISIPEVLQIAIQCAEALRSAHAAGLVHCDIKPDNIMLAARPKATPDTAASDARTTTNSLGLRVKVLDFGVAKLLPVSDPEAPTTDVETQVLSGTPGYIAPEVLRDQVADGRADIFSLGVVLYELLAGNNPFQGDTIFATAERVMHEDPPPLRGANPNVSRALEAVIARMLAKDKNQRYANADDLLSDLQKVQGPVEVRELIAGTVHGPKRWHAILLVLIGLLFSVGLIVAGYKAGAFGRWGHKPSQSRNIAVLPFNSPGDDASTRAFSDGLAETVAARLTGLTDRYPIQIVPPSEVREQGVTTTDQARQVLGVNLVLVGTLRASGGLVRVNYSLIDANTRRQVRGDSITADAANPFAVEDRVVDSVLSTLEIALEPSERRALVAHRTSEPQAYDYYLQARGYLQNPHKMEDLDSAIDQFQHALERDPNYALAYAGLGEAYWYKYDNTKDPQWINKATPACERAVALDMGSAEAHLCLGMAEDGTGQYELAVQQLQRAAELQPTGDAIRWLARAYEDMKNLPEAEATFKRAVTLRPSYWGVYNALGAFYFRHSRFDEAIEQFKKAVSMSPDNFRAYSNLGGVYLARGDYDKGIENLERSVAIRPTGDALSNLGAAYFYLRRFPEAARTYDMATKMEPSNHIVWGNLGEAYYWMRGKQAETRRALTEALRLAEQDLKINPRDTDALKDAAGYHAMLGDKAKAFEFMQRGLAIAPSDAEVQFKAAAINQLSGNTTQALEWLRRALAAGYGPERIRDDPAFDALKDDPRFQGLITRKK